MPYGAHETMEVHEILMEKINAITHFNLYAKETQNPQLQDMIARHQQEEILSYNEIVAYIRENKGFSPIPPNTDIKGVSEQQIQYGLNKPPQFAPQSDASLSDEEIAIAMLLCHKNGARNAAWASLECADPNLRRMLQNSSASCANQAYEVFLLMNEQGLYQVPTLKNQTAETFLHSYQPANEALEAQYAEQAGGNAGYGGQAAGFASQSSGNIGYAGQTAGYLNQSGRNMGFSGQSAAYASQSGRSMGYGEQMPGYAGQSAYGNENYANPNMAGSGSMMSSSLNAGSRKSVLYGDSAQYGGMQGYGASTYPTAGRGGSSAQNQASRASVYGNPNAQGSMPQ